MKTHIERLPEYYPVNRLPSGWDQEEAKEMATIRMLVIDDEMKIRILYKNFFDSKGYEVETACNAIEAHGLLVHNKYDIVLLDINMAEVDGATLFEIIRTFHKRIKVVISSVYSINEQRERVKDADAYFDKSDDKEVLLSTVSSLLSETE